MTHHHRNTKRSAEPDIEETKEHIMKAGTELLFAAHGALKFCKEYVEKELPKGSRENLTVFFAKALSVADELGKSISGACAVKRAAENFAKPIFTAMEKEMRHERSTKRSARSKRTAKK